MVLFIIFGLAARSLTWQSTLTVFVLLVLAIPVRVRTQCPECIGQYIKTVDTITGECISCFPCLRCDGDYTSSVPCGATVPFGTDIKCVLIPSDPVVLPDAGTQTQYLNSLPLAISSKFIVAPATSIVHPTTSSSASTRSSIKGTDRSDTKKQKSEKDLALAEWKKDSRIYIFGGIFLAVALVAVMYRIRRKSRKQVLLQPVDHVKPDPSSPIQSLPDVLRQDRETCSINCTTNTVEFRRHNGCASEIGDGNQRSQCLAAQSSSGGNTRPSDLVAAPVDAVQLHTRSLPPEPLSQSLIVQNGAIADGILEQGRPSIWSTLSQRQKYDTKVLEIPYPLLYKICLTLDIPRADGNDVRMLAYKLGISLPDLAILKQAAITQQPDNNYFNSTSYVVLNKNHSLSVKGFVGIMEGIERDDIIYLINDWSN